MASYKEHPFYKEKLQSQRDRRPPAYSSRSNYSTASSTKTGYKSKVDKFSVDDFFSQDKNVKTHEQIK
jgi:hypothetical protein